MAGYQKTMRRLLREGDNMNKDLEEINKWLDSLIVEINQMNEVLEDLIAKSPNK